MTHPTPSPEPTGISGELRARLAKHLEPLVTCACSRARCPAPGEWADRCLTSADAAIALTFEAAMMWAFVAWKENERG